jgi:hypothetical protein
MLRWLGPATRARSIRSNAESLPIIPRRLRSPEIVRIASGGCGEVRCGLSQGLASGFAFVFLGPDPWDQPVRFHPDHGSRSYPSR